MRVMNIILKGIEGRLQIRAKGKQTCRTCIVTTKKLISLIKKKVTNHNFIFQMFGFQSLNLGFSRIK